MSEMFKEARSFNQPLDRWDVSQVGLMNDMFRCAQVFNQDVSGWSVGRVRNMSGMWAYAKRFNQSLSGWDVSNVVRYGCVIRGSAMRKKNLPHWVVGRALRTKLQAVADAEHDSVTHGDLA
jgi:hypothetical protein